jgi:hypothetical protein
MLIGFNFKFGQSKLPRKKEKSDIAITSQGFFFKKKIEIDQNGNQKSHHNIEV